jgi:hypothetical protein
MPTAKTGLQFEYFYALSLHCNEKNAHLIFTAFVIHGFYYCRLYWLPLVENK